MFCTLVITYLLVKLNNESSLDGKNFDKSLSDSKGNIVLPG